MTRARELSGTSHRDLTPNHIERLLGKAPLMKLPVLAAGVISPRAAKMIGSAAAARVSAKLQQDFFMESCAQACLHF